MKEITAKELNENFVRMISEDWALLTAGTESSFNTMTVSWGGIGQLWEKAVGFVFVRPQRYTLEFMEKSDRFTLSFFGGNFKKELALCGSKSGRDTDKIKETGLAPVFADGTVSFEQAKITIVMRKLACQDMTPECFLDPSIMDFYAEKDYHRVYIGEIEKITVSE